MTNGGDPAFLEQPRQVMRFANLGKDVDVEEGLTKREYFAAMALQGMLASCPEGIRFNPKERPLPWEAWAESCLTMADALIAELNKK